MSRRHLAKLVSTGLILIGFMTGCTSTSQDSLAPQNLNVQMAIADPQTTSVGVAESFVSIKVTLFEDLSYAQARVLVSESDTFSCDGTTLIRDGSLQYSFLGRIPSTQAQGEQSCTYTHDAKATRIRFATPQRPVILAPPEGAKVSMAQDLRVQFMPSLTAPTVISIDGTAVITLAQPIGEAIIPSQVLQQFLTSETSTLSVSQTSLLTPASDFNDLEIQYTSSNIVSLSRNN